MIPYELTPDAEADLREIARYIWRQWGETQSRQYARTLATCFQKIADGEIVRRSFSNRFPELLAARCEHHFIFYLHPEDQKPRIIAVLHERMDLITRLRDRLP
jgi:plasmid stabilization system protein ParE